MNKTLELVTKLTPLAFQQVRFRNRPNLQRPLPMHLKRKKLFVVCEPVLRPTQPICERTWKPAENTLSIVEENPYALYLAGKLRRDFAKHPMIAIFHYDSYSGRELMNIRLMLHDNNFPMEIQEKVNKKVTAAAFQGTKWAAVTQLCQSRTAFGFCKTTDVPKMMKMLKKMPAFILLGLIYENRLLHRDDVDRVVKLSNILNQHAQLSTTLNLPTMNLCQNLMMGQVTLTNNLSAYAKSQGETSSSSSSSSDSESSSSDDSDNENENKTNA